MGCKRKYLIPAGVLKAGKNVIAIRVVDNTGGGGIWGDSADLKLNLDDAAVSLCGKWKWQVESIQDKISENSLPSLCYNAMINPLIPFKFKGVLWYQGESNATRAYQYRKTFPLLIQDWRKNQGRVTYLFILCNWQHLIHPATAMKAVTGQN